MFQKLRSSRRRQLHPSLDSLEGRALLNAAMPPRATPIPVPAHVFTPIPYVPVHASHTTHTAPPHASTPKHTAPPHVTTPKHTAPPHVTTLK
jgi:hypothetical protein